MLHRADWRCCLYHDFSSFHGSWRRRNEIVVKDWWYIQRLLWRVYFWATVRYFNYQRRRHRCHGGLQFCDATVLGNFLNKWGAEPWIIEFPSLVMMIYVHFNVSQVISLRGPARRLMANWLSRKNITTINLSRALHTRHRPYAPQEATGIDERFADPEVSPVASFSSRGPCYINSGSGLEERLKPVTTAANGIETSTGTSVLP